MTDPIDLEAYARDLITAVIEDVDADTVYDYTDQLGWVPLNVNDLERVARLVRKAAIDVTFA